MQILIWTAASLVLLTVVRIILHQRIRLSNRIEYHLISLDDPKFSAPIAAYFRKVADALASHDFHIAATLIAPKHRRGRTLYVLILENRTESTVVTVSIFPYPLSYDRSPSVTADFCTHLQNQVRIETNISQGNSGLYATPPFLNTVNLPGVADLELLFQAHRFHLSSFKEEPRAQLPKKSEWPEFLSKELNCILEWYSEEGWLKKVSDHEYAPTSKLRWRLFRKDLISREVLQAIKRRRRTRQYLTQAGLESRYKYQSMARLVRDAVRPAGQVFQPMFRLTKPKLLQLTCVALLFAYFAFQMGHPKGTFLFGVIGLIALVIVSLAMASRVVVLTAKSHYCRACGHDRGPNSVWCQACGEGLCFRCGYNLFGNQSGCCPECGTQYCTQCGRSLYGRSADEGCPDCGNALVAAATPTVLDPAALSGDDSANQS
ncbi:hypothetical protein RAS2_24420 [Phycisphaerae bacterium RAS2]|nr:hypothetical protein RAS2_24420 [Phycisphaerae bacterium RAS2]